VDRIKAIAIDDEPLALEVLESYCADIDFIRLEKTFTQTHEAKKYLQSFATDLIFLDVNMPAISGIDFYKGLGQDIMVIFTTAHAQYALDGFELSAVDFLLKPYAFERFSTAAHKAKDFYDFLHHKQAAGARDLFIRSEYSLVKIQLEEIAYIEGLADYLKIHLTNGKVLLPRMTMKGILQKLPAQDFARVHRSFIIPLKRVQSVRNKTVQLVDQVEIPIGVSYEDDFRKVFGPGK
jgi:DNA-binding LytR/AlgR family response regulator